MTSQQSNNSNSTGNGNPPRRPYPITILPDGTIRMADWPIGFANYRHLFFRTIEEARAFMDAVTHIRDHGERTREMHLHQDSPAMRVRIVEFLVLNQRFVNRWGHGAVPDDIRRAWNIAEGVIGRQVTVLGNHVHGSLLRVQRISLQDRHNLMIFVTLYGNFYELSHFNFTEGSHGDEETGNDGSGSSNAGPGSDNGGSGSGNGDGGSTSSDAAAV